MKRDLLIFGKKLSKTISKNSPAILKTIGRYCKKHDAEIFTGLSIAGVAATGICAAKNTLKASEVIKKAEEESEEPLKLKDKAYLTWKIYIPTLSSAVFTCICVGGINSSHKKRTAGAMALYQTAATMLANYEDAVVEVLDEEQYKEVKDKIAEHQVQSNPIAEEKIYKTGNGDVLCYDPYSARYFMSSPEALERAMNEINKLLLDNPLSDFVEMNEWYDRIGLDVTAIGDKIGWGYGPDFCNDLVELRLSSQLTRDSRPCLVVNFDRTDWY